MSFSSHILTFIGASLAALGAFVLPWSTLQSAADVTVPGYAVSPIGQVVAALSLVLMGMVGVRQWTRKTTLDGAIVLTAVALVGWLVAGAGLAWLAPAGFDAGIGVSVCAVGGLIATASSIGVYGARRLQVRAEVTVGGRTVTQHTMRSAGLWRAITPHGGCRTMAPVTRASRSRPGAASEPSAEPRGSTTEPETTPDSTSAFQSFGPQWCDSLNAEPRPAPAFQVGEHGQVAIGVARQDAPALRLCGQVVPEARWLGDPNGAVQAMALLPGEWGVLSVGDTATRFEVSGDTLSGRFDAWGFAAVLLVAMTQVGLLALSSGESPWDPASSQGRMPATVWLDSRPVQPAPVPPASAGGGAIQAVRSEEVARRSGKRIGAGVERRRASSERPRGSQNLADLLQTPGSGGALEGVLKADDGHARRFDTVFSGQGTASPEAPVLAYRQERKPNGPDDLGPLTGASSTTPSPSTALAPKGSRKVPSVSPAAGSRVSASTSVKASCEGLAKAVKRRSASLRACLTARQQFGAVRSGRVTVGLTSVPGARPKVRIIANSTGDRELARCLLRRARQMARPGAQACAGKFTFHVGR